jgi:hypothetical protein
MSGVTQKKTKRITHLYNGTMPARHRRRKGDWVLWLESKLEFGWDGQLAMKTYE